MGPKIITVAIGIVILLTITAFGNGFNYANANHDTVRVDCKDLAIALITWDQLLATTDDDVRTDIEDNLGEDGIANGLFQDWIDKYLDDLVDDVDDDCNHLKNDIEDYLDDMELEVP
jgi:transcription termination factor NusB